MGGPELIAEAIAELLANEPLRARSGGGRAAAAGRARAPLDASVAMLEALLRGRLMRVLYVVQRYGETIAGGAEQHCRELAERMAGARPRRRGRHDVRAVVRRLGRHVSSRGARTVSGVVVHRVPVAPPRDNARFNELNRRMLSGPRVAPALRCSGNGCEMQGPWSPELVPWLERNAHRFDCVDLHHVPLLDDVGRAARVAGRVPLVLHPTVHDEPPLRLSIFEEVLRAPDEFVFLTPEEVELVRTAVPARPPGEVVGIGVEVGRRRRRAFRRRFGLGDEAVLLYVGRVDPAKGALELIDYFVAYKDRHPDRRSRLVLLGESCSRSPNAPTSS